MSEPGKQPEIHSAIAEAIRSKRGKSNHSAPIDLAALEASLVAEIEAFELTTAPPPEKAPAGSPNPATGKPFPEILASGAARVLPAEAKPSGKPPSELPGNDPAPQVPKVGLLDQLRQQVQSQQQDNSVRQRELAVQEKRLDAALRTIFSYCHELVQQLNILHPPVGRRYSMLGSFEFSDLEWKKGFTDYRTRPGSAESVYETVTLNCLLSKAEPERVRLERDVLAADNFRKTLFDQGLVFTCEEIRNARHMVEKAIFSISAEVKVNLRWQADPNRGALILETRNLERFGSLSYVMQPESVGPAMLDEYARLLLGQPNRFRNYCTILNPSDYSR